VITEKKIPGEAIEEILKLKTVRAVSVL